MLMRSMKNRAQKSSTREFEELRALYHSFPSDVRSIIYDDAIRIVHLKEDIIANPHKHRRKGAWEDGEKKSDWLDVLYDDKDVVRAIMKSCTHQLYFSAEMHEAAQSGEVKISEEVFLMHLTTCLELSASQYYYFCCFSRRNIALEIGRDLFHKYRHLIIGIAPKFVNGLDWSNKTVIKECGDGKLGNALALAAIVDHRAHGNFKRRLIPNKVFAASIRKYPLTILAVSPHHHKGFESLAKLAVSSLGKRFTYPSELRRSPPERLYMRRIAFHVGPKFWRNNQALVVHFFKLGYGQQLPRKTITSIVLAMKLVEKYPFQVHEIVSNLTSSVDNTMVLNRGCELISQQVRTNPLEFLPKLLTGALHMKEWTARLVELAVTNLCCRCKRKRDCCIEVLADINAEHRISFKMLSLLYPFVAERKIVGLSDVRRVKVVRDTLRI